MVERSRKIDEILERDLNMLSRIFHCKFEKLQEIALAVTKQLLAFNILSPMAQLHQQEIILKLIYQDTAHLTMAKIRGPQDLDRMATIMIDTYAELLAPELASQTDLKVYDYLYNNRTKLRELLDIIHNKFIESGYLKAA